MKTYILIFLALFAIRSFAQETIPSTLPSQKKKLDLVLFPNPANEILSVKIQGVKDINNIQIQVYNLIGMKQNIEQEKVGINEILLIVKDIPTGYYLLSVHEASGYRTMYKFLKR